MITALAWILGGIAVVLGAFWLGQRRLIYLADTSTPALPTGVEQVGLDTDDGLTLIAWWVEPATGFDTAVIVLPGNAGHRGYRLPLAHALAAEGLAVLLVDYRGYGGNPGSPTEDGLLADARAARQWIDSHQIERVIYFGESLGSGPATALAREVAPHALVLRSPYPSLVDVARIHYPFLPAGMRLRDRFPLEVWIADLDVPVVVIAGSKDSIIPTDLSRRVAEVAGAELVVIEGADHNDRELGSGSEVIDAVVRAAR